MLMVIYDDDDNDVNDDCDDDRGYVNDDGCELNYGDGDDKHDNKSLSLF
jgi:hypothetical protein